MDPIEIMKRPAAYASGYENTPTEAQARAKQLCWEYNRTAPNETESAAPFCSSCWAPARP